MMITGKLFDPMTHSAKLMLPYAGEVNLDRQDLDRKGPVRPLRLADGKEYYVMWMSNWQHRSISRAAAEIDAQAEVAQRFPDADRRRIKREVRKAVDRRRGF